MEPFIIALLLIVLVLGYLLAKSKRGISLQQLQMQYVHRKDFEDVKTQLQGRINEIAELRHQLGSTNSLDKHMKQLEQKFEILSGRMIKEGLEQLKDGSGQKLAEVINPFKDQLTEFKLSVEKARESGVRDSEHLKSKLQQLTELNQHLSSDAKNLTKALKMDPKKRGNWGEIMLETVLEKSGLMKDIHYSREVMGVSDEVDLRADVIVNLPGGRHLVIDSKVTLNAYLNYSSEEEEEEANMHLIQHIEAVKTHIKTLAKKRYDRLHTINSPDFVFMFMPLESAFHDAVRQNPDLYLYAIDRNVVLVTASTLLASLITIATSWQQDLQRQNVDHMADLSGKLHDQILAFLSDMEGIHQGLKNATGSYESAAKRLSTGNNNVIRLTGKLKELGAKVKDKKSKTLENYELKHALG